MKLELDKEENKNIMLKGLKLLSFTDHTTETAVRKKAQYQYKDTYVVTIKAFMESVNVEFVVKDVYGPVADIYNGEIVFENPIYSNRIFLKDFDRYMKNAQDCKELAVYVRDNLENLANGIDTSLS